MNSEVPNHDLASNILLELKADLQNFFAASVLPDPLATVATHVICDLERERDVPLVMICQMNSDLRGYSACWPRAPKFFRDRLISAQSGARATKRKTPAAGTVRI